MLAAGVRRDQEAGRIANARAPKGVADSLVALWDGLQLQWLIDPRRDIVAAMTAALTDLLGPHAVPRLTRRADPAGRRRPDPASDGLLTGVVTDNNMLPVTTPLPEGASLASMPFG